VDQAVLETVARVTPNKNETKDEKYLICHSFVGQYGVFNA